MSETYKHEKPKNIPIKTLAKWGAIAAAGAAVGIGYIEVNGRAPEVSNVPALAGEQAPGGDGMVTLKYDAKTDKDVFGFADRHLEGDPNSHLLELKAQLPEEDRAGYDAQDGFEFKVKATELDDASDPAIQDSAAEG